MKNIISLSEKIKINKPIQNKTKQINRKNIIDNNRKESTSSVIQKFPTIQKRIKLINLLKGREKTQILLNSRDKSKLLKKIYKIYHKLLIYTHIKQIHLYMKKIFLINYILPKHIIVIVKSHVKKTNVIVSVNLIKFFNLIQIVYKNIKRINRVVHYKIYK